MLRAGVSGHSFRSHDLRCLPCFCLHASPWCSGHSCYGDIIFMFSPFLSLACFALLFQDNHLEHKVCIVFPVPFACFALLFRTLIRNTRSALSPRSFRMLGTGVSGQLRCSQFCTQTAVPGPWRAPRQKGAEGFLQISGENCPCRRHNRHRYDGCKGHGCRVERPSESTACSQDICLGCCVGVACVARCTAPTRCRQIH